MEMNFIDPLSITSADKKYILNLGCYMSRFSVLFICESSNSEDVIRYLKLFFTIYRKSYTFYVDQSHYFDNKLRDFLKNKGIAIDYSPSASHKSTNLIEVINYILKEVIRKLELE